MAEPMTPAQEAAAFHGIALNYLYPVPERLHVALKALEYYEKALGRTWDEGFEAGCDWANEIEVGDPSVPAPDNPYKEERDV